MQYCAVGCTALPASLVPLLPPAVRRFRRGAARSRCLACALALAPRARRAQDRVHDHRQLATTSAKSFKPTLPPDDFDFVELVERGRPDWLASACQQQRAAATSSSSPATSTAAPSSTPIASTTRESLPVDEMERVACSESCPGLFSQLKEVYLFGCNTLNAQAMRSALGRSRAQPRARRAFAGRRAKRSRACWASATAKATAIACGTSSRTCRSSTAFPARRRSAATRARCSSATCAPAASSAAAAPARSCSPRSRASSMTVTAGMTDDDPRAGFRRDVCQFSDDRLPRRAQGRLPARAAASRHGRSAHVPRPPRALLRVAHAHGARSARRRRRAATRSPTTTPRGRAISSSRAMPTTPPCACAWLALARQLGWLNADAGARARRRHARRAPARGNGVGVGRRRPRVLAQQGRRARCRRCGGSGVAARQGAQCRARRGARVPRAAATGAARVLRAWASASDDEVADRAGVPVASAARRRRRASRRHRPTSPA